MAKRINANFYTDEAYVREKIPPEDKERLKDDDFWRGHDYWYVKKTLPGGRLYSGWGARHPTKITPEDLPPDYIRTHDYKKKGYIRTAGVKDLVYHESPFHNHAFKDDFLYISYGDLLPKYKMGDWSDDSVYAKCDEYIWGGDIVDFIFAVEKNSPDLDVSDIKRRMVAQYNAYCDEMNEWEFARGAYKHIKELEELR